MDVNKKILKKHQFVLHVFGCYTFETSKKYQTNWWNLAVSNCFKRPDCLGSRRFPEPHLGKWDDCSWGIGWYVYWINMNYINWCSKKKMWCIQKFIWEITHIIDHHRGWSLKEFSASCLTDTSFSENNVFPSKESWIICQELEYIVRNPPRKSTKS